MRLIFSFWLIFIFAALPGSAPAGATERLNTPANPGYSGLWDMPNARVLSDWHIRLGGATFKPYYYVYGALGLFDRLEINGRFTRIEDIPIPALFEPNYGDYKDKAIDLKLLIFKEKGYWPALTLGATDVHGTGVFTSRYLVGSKRLGRFDLTLGLGQGMLGGKSMAERAELSDKDRDPAFSYLTSEDTQFSVFGGLEYALSEDFILSAEYSSIKYEKVMGGHEAGSPLTFGLKYRLGEHWLLTGSYARGEEFSGGIHLELPLEPEGPLGWRREPPPARHEKNLLLAARAEDEALARLLVNALEQDGFPRVKVIVSRPNVWIELENTRYSSPVLAVKRTFLVVDALAPDEIKELYLVLTRDEIFQTGLKSSREHLHAFVKSRLDSNRFFEFSRLSLDKKKLWSDFCRAGRDRKQAATTPARWTLSLKPKLATYINDPSGFLKTRFSIYTIGRGTPWKGALFTAKLLLPIYNDISSSVELREPDPSRTDIINYLSRKEPHLVSYGYDQVFGLPGGTRARFGAGAFEAAYAGFGAEVFKFIKEGRYGLGLEGALVWKRDLENDFELHQTYNKPYHTYHLNLYGQPYPRAGVEVGLRIGRFLGGDHGVRFEACRTFKHYTIGGWYTVTDTSHFESPYNRDYNDKGVFILIPMSIFTSRPIKGRLLYSISPWTRDPGQMVRQFRRLYPFGGERVTPSEIKKNIKEMQW